jgi:hypothetical protein
MSIRVIFLIVKYNLHLTWDRKGTSYPPGKDKMYDG